MKPYPAYKDSGIEWIGKIPEHWDIVGLTKYLESIVDYRGRTPPKTEEGILLVTAKNIKTGVIDYSLSQEYVNTTDYNKIMSRGYPEVGDVLFTTEAPLGEVANVDNKNIALAQRIIKFRANREHLDNYFLKYWLLSYSFQSDLQRYATGSTALGIKASKLNNLKLILPPIVEQEIISTYIDRKTSQINTIIEKKQKQIELLKEERTAIINQVVTKGLNPDVPMKDSGIEWLGEVPEHWSFPKMKFVCSLIRDGTHQPPARQEEGIPLLSVRNIVDGKFVNLPDDSLIAKEDYLLLKKSVDVLENDIVLAIVGATLGKVAIVEKMLPFTIQRSLAVFRPLNAILHFKYLLYYFQSSIFQTMLWKNVGFSAQPGIYLGALSNFQCILPPLDEQKNIVTFIDNEFLKINTIIEKTNNQIILLQEYRTALISNAVTGKIDVRDTPTVILQ